MINPKYITHAREPFFQIALDYIEPTSKVLDIGAGNGSFAKFCQRDDFYLYDGNKESVKTLKADYPNSVYGRLPELPFEDQFFDLIHCSHVIEHLQPQDLYDSLVQMDRVLKIGGILVISTPLLWEGFYQDLSHIKPYDPLVLEKYLTGNYFENLTRDPVSINYSVERLEYRYHDEPKETWINQNNDFSGKIFLSLNYRLRKKRITRLVKTGYTMVLKKNG
ncbi:MAG: class I SAM-dependent methyltransferase [Bacteroidota bacterium]